MYRVGVRVRGEAGVTFNQLRFPTAAEAQAYATDLAGRWTLVEDTSVERIEEEPC